MDYFNWYTVNTGKLAPKGWHVPSDSRIEICTTYLGGEIGAAIELEKPRCRRYG